MPFFPNISLFSRSSSEWLQILYDDRELCSKPAPLVYSISLSTTHCLAVPIYLAAFWTLRMEKSESFRGYKKYLAVHTIFNLLFEFHLSVIMKPVLYLPYLLTRFTGIWIFGFVNGGILFYVFMSLATATLWSIVELFYFRFKSISSSGLCDDWVQKYAIYALLSRYVLILMTFVTLGTLAICVVGLFLENEYKLKLPISQTQQKNTAPSSKSSPESTPKPTRGRIPKLPTQQKNTAPSSKSSPESTPKPTRGRIPKLPAQPKNTAPASPERSAGPARSQKSPGHGHSLRPRTSKKPKF